MATLAAERGDNAALNAWLEDIRDDAAKLAEKTHGARYEIEEN